MSSSCLQHQRKVSFENDLLAHLADLLAGTGMNPADTGGTITFAGSPAFSERGAVRFGLCARSDGCGGWRSSYLADA